MDGQSTKAKQAAGKPDRRRSREAGFDLHLTKPVDPVELERLLADPLGRGAV